MRPILFIDGRSLPMIFLERNMALNAKVRSTRRERDPQKSNRGEAKRRMRKRAMDAYAAQKKIESAFKTIGMNWRAVEKDLKASFLKFKDIQTLATRHGLTAPA